MRADRLLSIILLIQRQGHMTAQAVAKALGVTQRTIYRDIEALSLAGVPIYTQPGPNGGVFLDEAYRNSLNWFTSAELQTLLFTGTASPLADLGMQQAADNAILKLLALLPGHSRQEAEHMRQRLYLDPTAWYGGVDEHPTLPLLKEAVWGDFLIDATYENWEGEQRQVILAPYSLVYKAERWYLVAGGHSQGKLRTYRVSRLSEVRLHDEHFERTNDFDIVDYWEQASEFFLQRMPTYPVRLRVRPEMMIYFESSFWGRYEIERQDNDWSTLRVHYTVYEEARASALGLGTAAEVLEPVELQQAVKQQVRQMAAKLATAQGQ